MDTNYISVLIAEDDPRQMEYIVGLISKFRPHWKIDGLIKNSIELNSYLRNNSPSLAILDVNLSDINCVDYLKESGAEYQVVFITGESDYAVDAFYLDAIDFILKPIHPERFEMMILKVESNLEKNIKQNNKKLEIVKFISGNELVIKPLEEVIYFEAQRKNTRVVCSDIDGTLRIGINNVYSLLNDKKFQRIHRSYIVNINKISRAWSDELGRTFLKVCDRSDRLLVSKPYEYIFKDGIY